jgi:uncharacterized protein YaeQ
MALQPTRMEFRIALSHIDRGRDAAESVVVGRHPSEAADHLILRVLAWCLLQEDRLTFADGLADPDQPDLWTHDLTGRVVTWIECGAAAGDKLKKVLQHNTDASVHVVLADARRERELLEEIAAWKRVPDELTIWSIDPALVSALATSEARRQSWTVTVVGDHLYVEADGVAADGEIRRAVLDS